MLLGIILILVIIGMGVFLFIYKPPTAVVLPVAAALIALIAFMPSFLQGSFAEPLNTIFGTVLSDGFTRLAPLIVAAILGAVLAAAVDDAGIARHLVRFAAEFAGDSPFLLTLLLTLVIALLFTNLGGLGAVIMVATTALPLMLAMGMQPLTAGAVFLLALSLGGCLNPVNWQLYITVLGLPQERIIPYALALFAIFLAVTAAFAFVRVHREQGVRASEMGVTALCALVFIAGGAFVLKNAAALGAVKIALFAIIGGLAALLTILAVLRVIVNACGGRFLPGRVHWLSICALIYPLLLLLAVNLGTSIKYINGFTMPIGAALLLGIVYAHAASWERVGGEVNRLMRAAYAGFRMAIPAILLMFGIGMLLQATMLPQVTEAVGPLVRYVLPTSPLAYIIAFTAFAPLALYRGPLNLYGMGSGIVGLFMKAGVLTAPMLMGAFFSVGMMQGVCDPTNTHNAWLAGFLRVRVLDLTRATILWVWAVVLLGLALAVVMFGMGG